MRRVRTRTEEYLECDGCKYILSLTTEEREREVEIESIVVTLTIPWPGEELSFHFHNATTVTRHDCFRYWAHNPLVMKSSLQERGLSEETIDEFMSMYLYRENNFKPGIEREAIK